MEAQSYYYRVTSFGLNQPTTLMHGDIFKFSIRVLSRSCHTGTTTPLLHRPCQSIPCHNFFHEVQDFLGTLLCSHLSLPSLEEITEGVVSDVREMFDVDAVASSQHREIPLWLVIVLFDSNGVHVAMEESMQDFRMIPASNGGMQTLLKKSKVMTQSESCRICLEEFDVNVDCYTMPCHHVFHQHCILTWLKTSHVCPLCRYPLPTIKN